MEKKDNGTSGLRKRQLINAANKTVFMWIVIASIVLGVCGVVAQFLIQQLMFNNKIYGVQSTTSTTLENNIKAYSGLKEDVKKLIANESLTALRKGDNSTALQVIIDALPTEENKGAFATSMQTEVLGPSGVTLSSFSVADTSDISTSSSAVATAKDPIPFDCDFVITGSYSQIQQALRNLERSIRPITINSIEIQGSATKMQASITATTYYQPSKNVQLKEKPVKP